MTKGTSCLRVGKNHFWFLLLLRFALGIGESVRVFLGLALFFLLLPAAYGEDGGKIFELHIPADSAALTVKSLSRQTGYQVIFRSADVEDIDTNSLKGDYTIQQALAALLKGTVLSGHLTNSGIITISRDSLNNNEGQNMKTNKSFLAALTAFFTAIAATPHARSEEMPGRNTLEEIVVTAQKRSESLQDVPIAVSAFSGDDLIKYGVLEPTALQQSTPALVYNTTGTSAQAYLRGVGTRLSTDGLEPSIATYVDDRYIARPKASLFEFADIERIEILKGPQGTLYGRNATGGAIRVITKDVEDELEGKITASAGNYNYYGLSGTVNVPMTDNFGGRFTVLNKKRDGFVDNIFPGGIPELDDQDIKAYKAKFRWDMTDMVTARFSLQYSETNDNRGADSINVSNPPSLHAGIAAGGISGQNADKAATAMPGINNSDEFSNQLRFDVTFDNFDFASISTYGDFDSESHIDADGTSARRADSISFEAEKAFSQEFQFLSNSNSDWQWVTGAFFYDADGDSETLLDVGGANLISLGQQDFKTTAWAIFGQTTWNMTDRWALTLGGRWNNEEKELASTLSRRTTGPTVRPVPETKKEDWQEFTPKAVVEYHLDDTMLYLSYARGFKSGGFSSGGTGTRDLDPEILDMLELGMKSSLLDDQLRLNAAVYYYDYSDLQVTRASTQGGGTFTENAADSNILGMDLDIAWLVSPRMQVTAGLTVLDTEYKDFLASAKVFNASVTGNPSAAGMIDVPFDADGESMLRAPDWSGFVSIEYDFAVGDASMPAVLTYSYKDDYDFDFVIDPLSLPLRQEGYGILNARISYIPSVSSWIVALWGNNLTDEEYFDDLTGNGIGIRGSYGAPLTYGVDITYNF